MRDLGSLIMRCADEHRVPAGSALAVDRTAFADAVTRAVEAMSGSPWSANASMLCPTIRPSSLPAR